MRIIEELVTKYYSDICFLFDTNNTFVQAVKPRKVWLQIFEYEIDSNVISVDIHALLKEEIDVEVQPFGRYEEEKVRITVNIKIASKEKKRKKMIEDLEAKLGTLGKGKEPLKITQDLGEDEEQDSGDEEDEVEEPKKGKSPVVFMPLRKKAQGIVKKKAMTLPPPNKPRIKASTIIG